MNRSKMNPFLFAGLIGILTVGTNFAIQIYRAYWGNSDFWWTPGTAQLSIDDSEKSFRLFISGKLLQSHLADGTLLAVDGKGEQYTVVQKDLSVRLNNWNKVKSSILTTALISAFALGIAVTMLTTGAIQLFREQRKRS